MLSAFQNKQNKQWKSSFFFCLSYPIDNSKLVAQQTVQPLIMVIGVLDINEVQTHERNAYTLSLATPLTSHQHSAVIGGRGAGNVR